MTIAGRIIAYFVNDRPEVFQNRTVFTGDNHYRPANAYLNNLKIITTETPDDSISEMAPTDNLLPGYY